MRTVVHSDDAEQVDFGHFAHHQAEADIVGDAHMRKQRVGLEHHGGVALMRRHLGHAPVAEPDVAGIGHEETGDHAQGRGLAAAGGPEQGQEFAVGDVQAHAIDGQIALEAARQTGQA